ncbi:MAG TPA: bifunctional oligoribonuclease/PAP phosphatase NrnA [Saprospiraceae bacterium]|nr:bifunctional oligoribonuclease/PAP phosphatase NrnA [Saprospiraceae bacterium]HMP23897.1 bifunctional oligoribonuclease/PAP phosphatase NrnA [Saprospiraceae bacterium]
MEYLHEIKELLVRPKDIVITTHRNPDGDAIGASLAMYHYLCELGHTVRVICPSDYPDFLEWMPGVQEIIIFDTEPEYSKELVERADIIFFLDFNALDRIDKLGELIAPLSCTKIMIDHHLYPENCSDYLISDTLASSTCELIYDFIDRMGERHKIDTVIAESIFTGILTDTGSFTYSTSPKLFRTVAELIEMGVDDYKLQDLIFNSMQEKHLRLLGHCLNRRLEILEEYKTGIITLTKEDYERFDIQRGDTEGIVNYLLKLRNVKLAAFITEQPTIVKLSLRSKGDFSVQEIAKKYFKGGGHKNASGGYSFQSLRATVKKFKDVLPEYGEKLRG